MVLRNRAYLRVIDANLNRAREGLRVIEDTARFAACNEKIFRAARSARHSLDRATRKIYPELLRNRDSVFDGGRAMKESGKRKSLKALLSANFRRVEEALRVLEEYGKLVSPSAAPEFKRLRYKAYTLEKEFIVEH